VVFFVVFIVVFIAMRIKSFFSVHGRSSSASERKHRSGVAG